MLKFLNTCNTSLISWVIIILISSAHSSSIFAQDNTAPIYQCAPCGCSSDDKHFDKPGNCPSCGMKMEKVSTPNKSLITLDKALNVAILIYEHAQVLDYAAPYDIFTSGGENFNVYTVAETTEEVITLPNLKIIPQYDINNSPKADIIIIPGGMWDMVGEKTKSWIKDSSNEATYILSVCTGAFLLAEIGLLDSLDATTHSAGVDILEKNYPNINEVHRNVRYVDNGKIITSAGVMSGIDASLYLISRILGEDWEKAIKRNLEIQE